MDISFLTPEGKFNYRVAAVIIHNGKLLVMKDDRGDYFYLPGGRLKMHETMHEALLREIKEELGIDGKIVRDVWLNQNFFIEQRSKVEYHEICMYTIVDVSDTNILNLGTTFTMVDNGNNLYYTWMSIDDIPKINIYPEFIKKNIQSLPDGIKIINEYNK